MSNITRINYQDKEIILIATAHVSQSSVDEVRDTIEKEMPNSICVELDKERYKSFKDPNNWENQDIIQIIKQKKIPLLLTNLILGSFQRKIASDMNTKSGAEMIEGIRLAEETKADLVLADRSIQTTFRRVWHSLSFWEKMKLLAELLSTSFTKETISAEEIEKLKTQDALEDALKEISDLYPTIKKILVDERDQYLTYKIQNAKGPKIVAILGAAHTIGIKKMIDTPQNIHGLLTIPKEKVGSKALGWIIPTIVIAVIAGSFFLNPTFGRDQLVTWILYNGSASAIGCLLMLAHPLTILGSFVMAPITSLSPLIGVGFFSAIIEATMRRPKVKDFQNLSNDALTFKGFVTNKVSRIFLIFFVSSIFSAIATIVGGLDIFNSLIDKL